MKFSTKKAMENIKRICNVSKPFNGMETVEDILLYSRKRSEIFENHTKSLGLELYIQEFDPSNRGGIPKTSMKARNYLATYKAGDEEIWFLGHHDYEYCAGTGASDNASSLGIMMELARCVVSFKPKYTVRFASFDLEEKSLLGSWEFVGRWKGFDKIKAVINMDVVGGGKDLLICTKRTNTEISCEKLATIIEDIAVKLGHEMHIYSEHGFSSDHIPFPGKGVKEVVGLSAGNIDSDIKNGNINHSSDDVFENLKREHIKAAGEVLFYLLKSHIL